MNFDVFRFWSFVVTCCALALFVQAIMLMRSCRPIRHYWWMIPIAALPLGVSLWSLAVAGQAIEASYYFSLVTHIHLSPAARLAIKAQFQGVIDGCIRQTCLMALTFTLTPLIKHRLLRSKSRVLAWEMVQRT
jgi:hypothetical protein